MVVPLISDQQVFANVSESVVLSFRVDNVTLSDISGLHWYYSSDFTVSSPDFNSNNLQEITSLANRTSRSLLAFSDNLLSLSIINIVHDNTRRETDSGRYFLRAMNFLGENSSFIDLVILASPIIITSPQDQYVFENINASFECNTLMYPQHIISWSFRNFSGFIFENIINATNFSNKYFVSGNETGFGNLVIYDVTFSDRGTYTCMVSNMYGRSDAQADLSVHGKHHGHIHFLLTS